MSGPLGHGSTAGIGSKVGSEASGALTSFNPLRIAEFPGAPCAVIRVPWTPQRRDPSHPGEMVNQLILGEVVEILATDRDWARVRGPDDYEGWTHRGALLPVDRDEATRWQQAASYYSLGTRLLDAPGGARRGSAPWGSRLPVRSDGGVMTPAGAVLHPASPERLVTPARPSDARALCETALTWLGTPYVWGGRLRAGTDCSGFVQSILARHLVRLPRDSKDQFAAGTCLAGYSLTEGQPGDVWFFAWDGAPVSHVGFCLGGPRLLHASETRGGVAVDTLACGDGGSDPAAGTFERHLAEGFAGALRPLD